jgi:hypothetical protein
MINEDFFRENKYVSVKSIIPKDICRIATRYALLKEQYEFTPELGIEAQVENAQSVYADTLMETLMTFMLPHMEKHTGLSLCPTYTYYRVYRPGMTLEKHIDRPSCEISTTICMGIEYINPPVSDYNWGMYMGENNMIQQLPGDLIIYRGCEVEHWRDPFVSGEGSYQVQAFFHYIDKNGPYYPEFAFDKRPGIGFRHK